MSTVQVVPADSSDGLSQGTAFSDAKQNFDATLAAQVAFLNAGLQSAYTSKYNDWVLNITSGGFVPVDRRTPPPVPLSWMAIENAAPLYNGSMQSGAPVFTLPDPLPTYNGGITTPVLPAGHIHVGPEMSTKGYFQAADDDTVPQGTTVLNILDGHTYLKWGTPFRKQGFYQQVS